MINVVFSSLLQTAGFPTGGKEGRKTYSQRAEKRRVG